MQLFSNNTTRNIRKRGAAPLSALGCYTYMDPRLGSMHIYDQKCTSTVYIVMMTEETESAALCLLLFCIQFKARVETSLDVLQSKLSVWLPSVLWHHLPAAISADTQWLRHFCQNIHIFRAGFLVPLMRSNFHSTFPSRLNTSTAILDHVSNKICYYDYCAKM